MYIYYYNIIYYVYILLWYHILCIFIIIIIIIIIMSFSSFTADLSLELLVWWSVVFLCPWVLWFFSWPPGHHWGAPKWGPIPVQDLAGKWKVYLKFPQHLKSHAIRASRNGVPSKSTILEIRFQETIHLECSNFGHIICYIYTYLPPLPLSLSLMLLDKVRHWQALQIDGEGARRVFKSLTTNDILASSYVILVILGAYMDCRVDENLLHICIRT